jgi:hypothetical protein
MRGMNNPFASCSVRQTPQPPILCNGYRHADNVQRMNTSRHEAAVVLGSATSAKKAAAAKANGKEGGRPEGS